ncbi:MAG: hypothetical protein AVDCRST_MAG86-1267 [uncultured Truepera sp.]|uniref:Peptidase S24/S26A/S26B/S26C domain-containing protein n=1 Tax=uncultured Truepera sp. TaxID=543023 RepID=A0A6J4V4A1_9DEIN|nr:MAG: hypothetical protein AVDCRST_MAG86-1267 [uncultured Truepera sp.]
MAQEKLGLLLGGRREALRGGPEEFSGQAVADALGFSQAYISNFEHGKLERTVRRWKSDRVWALLKAYRLGDDEARALAEQYGLEIPHRYLQTAILPDPILRFSVHPEYEYFPVFHGAAAGAGDPEPTDPDPTDMEVVAIPKTHLRGRAKEDVRVALINGDCMISKGVRGLPKSIAHGDQVAYDTSSLMPQHNDIVVCFDHQEDKLIVKLFKEQEPDSDFIVLYPANANHPPVVRPKDDPQLSLRGVVFWRGGNIW